ncbi:MULTISPECIES: hypothetical protein [unclassified Nocardioides]|uniref:hypothetical protein n=1 Tax=unclassified Nocardioides TaxID=2615069 RepID=UPI001E57D7E1|nr:MULTISPECIES: hypothetical protein [unclassified Nocardioides]MCD4526425.1 hypothetical protein [Nocardioides sp. cx-173]MCD4533907.1 hypothetical protein [Nocardioides sp. cx-169]UGB41115.1 hypothetical protein LQ940_17300 [Nocardioides sp. cx-173]
MRRTLASMAVLVSTLATVTACGDDESSNGDGAGTETIEITFEGDTVTPNAERVEVGVDQPVDLVVTADEPGEIHVHSDPEQEFAYDAGETTFELAIDRPGVVEVESHDLDVVIVQLEVS